MADHLAVLNMPIKALRRSATVTSFEPFTFFRLWPARPNGSAWLQRRPRPRRALSIARRFASLDHISGGRAGWNIVTTSKPTPRSNSAREDHLDHDERYRRAREFYDVVTGLWDSFAEDAFVRDVESGDISTRIACIRSTTRAVSQSARPAEYRASAQGWPVIAQAGASKPGRELAAEPRK